VLARRLIAVSPDDAFAAQLSSALVALDLRVETYRDVASLGVDPLEGALCVLHVAGEVEAGLPGFVANLAPDCRIIAVLPRASLVGLVEIMERSDRVVGMIVAEDFDPAKLIAMASRVRTGDVFGVEKLMAPDTPVQAVLCEYSQRTLCRARVVAYASQHGVPRRLYAPIEQCIDEMLMNALYDAPVDETGKHVFAGVPVRTRVSQKLATNIVVQYACDGTRFAVAVRDSFGSIERDTVLRVLHKCLHAAQKIDKKAGGAGVGLYLMVNASSAVYFNVIPGVATEAICVFELARPKQQLDQFGFFREAIDVTGTLPAERPPAAALRPTEIKRPIGPKLLLAGGILSAALLGLAIWHRLASDSGVTEKAEPATVELDTKPTGAAVEVNGLAAGETPVTLTTFAPGTSLAITLTRKAFKPASVTLRVPARGKVLSHVETLVASDDFVTVKFVTTPPGAQVIRLSAAPGTAADRTYTPTELSVEVGTEQRFMLVMPGRVPLVIPPFTPERGAAPLEKGGELATGATLHVEGAKDAKITVAGTPHCAALDLPADCTLSPGDYSVEQIAPDGSKQTKTVKLTGEDTTLTF
jgi:hypothetical protein